MTTSRRVVDILIQSPDGDTIAVVEVKNIKDLTLNDAIELRHNLATYGFSFQAPFFLLLSQDMGFLWIDLTYRNLDSPPAYVFPMDKAIARYSNKGPGERLYGEVLELIVYQWLLDLSYNPNNNTEEPERSLALSGFIKSIQGAKILLEAEL